MANKDKYGASKLEILDDDSETAESVDEAYLESSRSPALNSFSKETVRKKTYTEELEEQVETLESEVQSATQKMQAALAGASTSGSSVTLDMPVSKQKVSFDLEDIDPLLIDVSPENERKQEFLDEISLSDILPTIRSGGGNQYPGMVRPKSDGRYELLFGSRRRAACLLAGVNFKSFIGDVPNEDVRALSLLENDSKDVSFFEKAQAYKRLIELGEYRSWNELSKAKGFSQSSSSRFKLLAELDEIFVRILPAPSDMAQSYGEIISKLKKKNPEKLFARAEELLVARNEALKEGRELENYDQIVAALKSAVRATSTPISSTPQKVFTSKDGKKILKRKVSADGICKIELEGLSEADIEVAIELINKKFKMDEVEG